MASNIFVATDESNMKYQERANIRLDFHQLSTPPKQPQQENEDQYGVEDYSGASKGDWYWSLYGFLKDEGLELSLQNNFKAALDLVGGLLGQLGEMSAGLKAGMRGLMGNQTTGYITTGLTSESSIILNAPLFWQGTDPITFTVGLYQIADKENQIIENYQRILEVLSPSTGAGQKTIDLSGTGPGLVYVHYFPSMNDKSQAAAGQGKIIFGPCLCERVSMSIRPPYSIEYMPIVGEYTFQLKTSRILDRSQIQNLFNNEFKYPKPSATGA